MSDVEEEGFDYNADLQWASDTESDARLVEVSEKTRRFLAERFTRRVPNSTRLATRRQFPLPKVPATRTPKLDQVIRGEVSSSVKTGDKELAKIQTYLLDAVAPLTSVLECAKEDTSAAVSAALQLLGNANAKLSNLRREKVVNDLNKSLLPLINADEDFTEAAPLLFGKEFVKRSKEHLEYSQSEYSNLIGERFSISRRTQVRQ